MRNSQIIHLSIFSDEKVELHKNVSVVYSKGLKKNKFVNLFPEKLEDPSLSGFAGRSLFNYGKFNLPIEAGFEQKL